MTPDPIPSTFDFGYPPIKGGQDAVLVTLKNALERYRKVAGYHLYIGTSSAPGVCAVGALLAEDGLGYFKRYRKPRVIRCYQRAIAKREALAA